MLSVELLQSIAIILCDSDCRVKAERVWKRILPVRPSLTDSAPCQKENNRYYSRFSGAGEIYRTFIIHQKRTAGNRVETCKSSSGGILREIKTFSVGVLHPASGSGYMILHSRTDSHMPTA